jgi:hypothetical protein
MRSSQLAAFRVSLGLGLGVLLARGGLQAAVIEQEEILRISVGESMSIDPGCIPIAMLERAMEG